MRDCGFGPLRSPSPHAQHVCVPSCQEPKNSDLGRFCPNRSLSLCTRAYAKPCLSLHASACPAAPVDHAYVSVRRACARNPVRLSCPTVSLLVRSMDTSSWNFWRPSGRVCLPPWAERVPMSERCLGTRGPRDTGAFILSVESRGRKPPSWLWGDRRLI